jgi:hypothetical protein
LGRLTQRILEAASRLGRRQWLTIAGVAAFVIGARWGLGRMEEMVRLLPQCSPQPRLQLAELPDWATKEGWTPRLASAVSMDKSDVWLDERLTERVAEKFRRSGWVKNVRWVRKRADGSVRVSCEFRRPVGMVQTREGFIPVDIEGYRLPEVYDRLSPGWIMIQGVASPPPPPGRKWDDGDVRAGIRLTAMLFDQPWANRITAIDVSNYHGRRDPGRHHIVLATQQGTRIRWGSAPGEEIEEPSPAEKIRNIEQQLRVESARAWIDVSVFADKVIVPADSPGAVRVATGAGPGR